jgi:hypothetical protein
MRPLATNPYREEVDAQVAEFFARGGEVKRDKVASRIQHYNGTTGQAKKYLKTANWCAMCLDMSPSKFQIMMRNPDFPIAYQFEGELYWKESDIRDYGKRMRAMR